MTSSPPNQSPMAPSTKTFGPQQADVAIDIVIVGASVAGLACAYSLQQAGHNVLVLEADRDLAKSPGGVRIPPNMSRILLQWGLGPDILEQTCGRCPKIVFHSGYTGEVIGELLFHEKVMEELAAEVYLVHHSDLIQMLYNLCVGAGAQVRFGARVVQIDSDIPSVTLASGERLRADLIVGCDGYQSIVQTVLDHEDKDGGEINYSSYIFTIPTSSLRDDKEFLRIVKEPTWNLWMGSGWSLLGHIMRNDTEFSVTLFRDEGNLGPQMDWTKESSIRDLNVDEIDLAPVPKRLMELAERVVRVKDARTGTPEYWYDTKGHVVVVGEAAHGLNPGSSHGAALAVEDAAVLGRLLSKLRSKSEIKRFLTAFQDIRHQRCENVRDSEQQKVEFVAMRPGPQRDARDHGMRLQMEQGQLDWSNTSESYLRKAWEEFRDMFGYDAYDDADTWWVEWGVLFERMNVASDCDTDASVNGDMFNGQVMIEKERYIG